jgi:hypothetical protein
MKNMKHLKKFEQSIFKRKGIESLSDYNLVGSFKNAVCDDNYNPTSTPYNDSGFSLDELENEILRRMNNDSDDDGSWEDENY